MLDKYTTTWYNALIPNKLKNIKEAITMTRSTTSTTTISTKPVLHIYLLLYWLKNAFSSFSF